jgi:hypothetical protein
MKKLFFSVLFLVSNSFFGQEFSEKEIINKVVTALKVNEKNLLVDKICLKAISNQNDKVIIVLPVVSNRDPECEECFDIDNNLLVWNKNTKLIESKYIKKAEWTSDALKFDEIKIDTGLYYLNKNTRAFGIRYSYRGSSSVDLFGMEAINLYCFKNNQIVEVLHDFELEIFRGDNGNGCENASFETSKSVFVINDKLTDKFNDIIVKTKFKDYSYDANCDKEIIKKQTAKHSILRFDEKQKKYILVK